MDLNCFLVGFRMILSSSNSLMGFRTHLSRTHDTFMPPYSGKFCELYLCSPEWQMGPGQKGPGKPIFSAEIIEKHRRTAKNS